MAWRKYRPKSDAEALKIALFEAQQHWLKAYQAEHGGALEARDHVAAISWFVGDQLHSLASKSGATAEALIDVISAACKDQWAQEQAERTRHQQAFEAGYQRALAKDRDEAKGPSDEADSR